MTGIMSLLNLFICFVSIFSWGIKTLHLLYFVCLNFATGNFTWIFGEVSWNF